MAVTPFIERLSEGRAVSGMKDTLRALNDGCVRRLILCASLELSAGCRCDDCLAVYEGMDGPPEHCLYCGSSKITLVDLKSAIIARAFRLHCSIEIVSRCTPELERMGGIGALLY